VVDLKFFQEFFINKDHSELNKMIKDFLKYYNPPKVENLISSFNPRLTSFNGMGGILSNVLELINKIEFKDVKIFI
jgi:hypothetical protein